MIVNIGKRVIIDQGEYNLERDASKPGATVVTHRTRGRITLPGNAEDAKLFIEAYLRCVNEEIAYRETKVE